MSRPSPLRSSQADTVSVCGRLLRKGQTFTVSESAIGDRERRAQRLGRIIIRPSNMPGQVQVVCSL